MAYFDSADIYIDSATDIKSKMARVDQIINALYSSALKAATNASITEYTLDDGQTKISCIYNSPDSVINSIKALEKIKSLYKNQLNGRVMRAVDSKNFNNGRRF